MSTVRTIRQQLIELGFDENGINACLEDIELRKKWQNGSLCLIYSRSNKQWLKGQIIEKYVKNGTNEIWLNVKYKNNKNKNIQTYNANIKPIGFKKEYPQNIMKKYLQIIKNQKINKNDIDLSIYKDNESLNCTNGDYANCAAINRLVVALKYYKTMSVKNNENDIEKLRYFMDVYTQIVDDNNHLMIHHSEQMNEIRHLMKGACLMNECAATQKHFESESNINVKDDQMVNFFVNLMDALHFWIYHCFESGFRVQQSESEHIDVEDEKTLFDAEFARITATIRKRKHLTSSFQRTFPQNNAKFVISKAEKDDTTFLDELYNFLNSEWLRIDQFKAFIDRELYDSESIKMDVLHYANIKMCKKSILRFIKMCKESILCFIKPINVNWNTFSVGMRFYYWPYYKEREELPANEQMINEYDNKHDHSGYKVSELWVKRKYSSFKEEITNWPNFNIEQYEEAMTKTTKFVKSEEIKKMSAKYGYPYRCKMYLHYEISFGALVCFYHILSLIFYTDYSKLSRDFSATFRRLHNFETMESIKQRNALYYWMSKYLRELVELFGWCSYGDTFEKKDNGWDDRKKPLDALRGPFYCGMNFELNIDSFVMRLNSPSSTSKHIEVALKFSGDNGVVFTFDTPRNDFQFCFLRSFACSHISGFKEEDECLFFGGYNFIKVVTVRLIKTKENMKNFVSALFKFDKFLTGDAVKMSNNECFIVESLVNLALNKKQTKATLPQYILDCFESFRKNKKLLVFDIRYLHNHGRRRINHLLFYSYAARLLKKVFKPNDDDLNNVVRSDLFALFPNVTSLVIDSRRGFQFCFSLMALLNVIFGTSLNKIVITATAFKGRCWIESIWNSHQQMLKKEYAAKGFDIQMLVVEEENEYILTIKNIHPRQ